MKREKKYIASCSFGKDSLATILLALENNEPLDRKEMDAYEWQQKNQLVWKIYN